jgi:hypothetical protein
MSEELVISCQKSCRSAFQRSEIYILANIGNLDSTLPEKICREALCGCFRFAPNELRKQLSKGIPETMPWPGLKHLSHLLCGELFDPGTCGVGKNARA